MQKVCLQKHLYVEVFGLKDTKSPFTHTSENAVIEASSTFHRSFIEFFMVMHDISMMSLIFVEMYLLQFFSKIKVNLKWLTSKLHRPFIEKFVRDNEKFNEASMKH